MKITIVYNQGNGCDYHRFILPFLNMPVGTDISINLVKYRLLKENDFDCDIFAYSRITGDVDLILKLKEKFGFKILVDFDDFYELYPTHILYNTWYDRKINEKLKDSARIADFVTVTNEQLYKEYRRFNENIEILPNALPLGIEPYLQKKENSDRTRFLYVAGSSHYSDLQSIHGLFRKLSSDGEFKKEAQFILCGYDNKTDSRNVWDKMESLCKIPNAYERRGTMSLNDYIKHYNHGDISIAPLVDNKFNNCKSNLKYIEAGCMRHPFICSNIPPYIVDKGKQNGTIYCDKIKEWYDAFKFFTKNKSAIEDYGNANYEYVKENYNLQTINKKRLDILNKLS